MKICAVFPDCDVTPPLWCTVNRLLMQRQPRHPGMMYRLRYQLLPSTNILSFLCDFWLWLCIVEIVNAFTSQRSPDIFVQPPRGLQLIMFNHVFIFRHSGRFTYQPLGNVFFVSSLWWRQSLQDVKIWDL